MHGTESNALAGKPKATERNTTATFRGRADQRSWPRRLPGVPLSRPAAVPRHPADVVDDKDEVPLGETARTRRRKDTQRCAGEAGRHPEVLTGRDDRPQVFAYSGDVETGRAIRPEQQLRTVAHHR